MIFCELLARSDAFQLVTRSNSDIISENIYADMTKMSTVLNAKSSHLTEWAPEFLIMIIIII